MHAEDVEQDVEAQESVSLCRKEEEEEEKEEEGKDSEE
jgi:hypothetical protein